VTGVIVKTMYSTCRKATLAAALLLCSLLAAGCEGDSQGRPANVSGATEDAKGSGPTKKNGKSVAKQKTEFGKNVWLETQGKSRRVIVGATVVLREGSYGLECLMCRKLTKEHESILATDADASVIHATLLLAGAEPGSPAYYDDAKREWHPPRGMRIKVLLQYEDKGKLHTVSAQEWVKNVRTKKALEENWVFAGSHLYPDADGKEKPTYGANSDGGYICIYNSPVAMLDLPISNPNKDPQEGREFQPFTERIPPEGTRVSVILAPEPEAKDTSKK
jgi:hypothetical protein